MTFLNKKVYSISEINRSVKCILEEKYPYLCIEGEVANVVKANYGNFYLTLKDSSSSISCIIWKDNIDNKSELKVGSMLIASGSLSLYEKRGSFQFIIKSYKNYGSGNLQALFEKIKNKLRIEGLFDSANKKRIPDVPKIIGIVSSSKTAAVRDVLKILKHRRPDISVIIYNASVQGQLSSKELSSAIKTATSRNEVEILIICRGGGSTEDLQSFNDEDLARSIFACHIPIISGVGHEIDLSIADMVSDVRGATPTDAALIATKISKKDILNLMMLNIDASKRHSISKINLIRQELDILQYRIVHPRKKIADLIIFSNNKHERIKVLIDIHINKYKNKIYSIKSKINKPNSLLYKYQQRLFILLKNIKYSIHKILDAHKSHLSTIDASIANPLDKGFAILQDCDSNTIYKKESLNIGDRIKIRLKSYSITAKVISID